MKQRRENKEKEKKRKAKTRVVKRKDGGQEVTTLVLHSFFFVIDRSKMAEQPCVSPVRTPLSLYGQ